MPDTAPSHETFHFFWGGPFSQWYFAPMKIKGVRYNCCEQYMMAEKARLFQDAATLDLILRAKTPKEQKELGRKVRNFNGQKWHNVAREIVYQGNLAKFGQNPALLDYMRTTVGQTIVEASPYDTIWGIGLSESDPRAQDRSQWRGKNWLGEALGRVRVTLCGA